MQERYQGRLACLIVIGVLCGLGLQPSAGAPVKDSIVVARALGTLGIDPGFLRESGTIVDNVFDTLVGRDASMKLVPDLATSWKLVNPTTWQFTLRHGITFQNGEPFNAEAVKYTVGRVLDPAKHSPTISYIRTIKRVDVVDPYTVNIVTENPDPLIPARFSRYPTEIVPPKYVQQVGDAVFSAHPVGTGPYQFVRWVKDDYVELEANPRYWRGVPVIKHLTFRYVPDDVARVAALQRGEADLISPAPPDWVATIERSPNLHVDAVKHGGLIVFFGLKMDTAPLSDVRVRRALAYAIDRAGIVKTVMHGFALPMSTQVGPYDFGYDPKVPPYPYDPAKAKALLAEAGFPNGFSIPMQGTIRYQKGAEVTQAVAQEFAAVGVRANVQIPDWSVYGQLLPVHKQAPIYMLGWGSTQTLDADAAIYAVIHSDQPYSTTSIPKLDQLLDDARSTLDPAKRADLYRQIQLLARDQVPMLTLYQEDKLYGVSNALVWHGRPDARMSVFDMRFK